MREVFEIAGAIIASVGGAGIIIIALSNYIGKIVANKIFEKEKAKYTKEIEKYKNELLKELERIKVLNEKSIFVSNLHFEKEFQIYLELWENLFNVINATDMLFPKIDIHSQEEEQKELSERHKLFTENYNSYSKTIIKYAPFYSKDMYIKFDMIKTLCEEQHTNFCIQKLNCTADELKIKLSELRKIEEISKEIKLGKDSLQDSIRSYLTRIRNTEYLDL